MRPQIREISSLSISDPIIVDRNQNDFKVSLDTQLFNSPNLTYTVESTVDLQTDYSSINDYNTNANWKSVLDLESLTSEAQGNVYFPVQAFRINVTNYISGTVKLTLLQANAPS